MKRLLISLVLVLGILASLSLSAFADEPLPAVTAWQELPLVVDEADLLTDNEVASLQKTAEEISERQQCQVVIYTTSYLGGMTPTEFSDEKLDQYGIGEDKSAMLLLIYYRGPGNSENYMELNRQGFAIEAITDYGTEHVFDLIEDDMHNGNFAAACSKYLSTADELLSMARAGKPYDEPQKEKHKPNFVIIAIISLLLGFLFSLIPLASMKSKIQNVSKKTNAASYVREGSMNLTTSRDTFLYANTTSRVINTGSSGGRSGGSSGGSTTHVSHSGSVHASSGRHF